jgi:PIN domain nuclease of toxin-antitoxin system
MTALLDTHFVLGIALGSKRLREYRWVERYAPWTVSPVSLLEIAFLGEVGRVVDPVMREHHSLVVRELAEP